MLNMYKSNAEPTNINHLLSNDSQVRTANHPAQEHNLATPFVLILGANKDTRFLFKTACEIWSFDVAEAKDLEQCLSLTAFKVPDLVLIDSEIDFQESAMMMSILRRYPVFKESGFVFISGHVQENVRQIALSAGANFFLVKPVDFELLEKFLRTYFRDKNSAIS